MKQRPLIRFDRNSSMAKKLAHEVSYIVKQERTQLFDFRKPDTAPILLILDRRNDPITPLLTPWTYQAMVHELVGIQNNRVDLSNVPDISKDLKEIVLSADKDPFFAKTMYLNFGDLGASIKDYVSQYQAKTKSNSVIESIADMKRFVEDYPEFRRLSGNVSKHVTLVSELSRLVSTNGDLLEVSELEQSLACNDSHNSDMKNVQQMLVQSQVSANSKLRLVALYALRYQYHSNNATEALLGLLGTQHPEIASKIHAVRILVNSYAGGKQRQENLFASSSFFARAQSGFKGLKGVENVYTQHEPLLKTTLTNLIKGKLKKTTHPYYDPGDGSLPSWAVHGMGSGPGSNSDDGEKPQDIIIFMVGGTTYEEARVVAEMNAVARGVRILIGGTTIHNSQSFLNDIEDAGSRWPPPPPATASERLASRVH
ncbi:Vps45p [Sugiyamaella lignohabitans]|uniref:Vacuolar protein sorting-associated protein 45 n=1 Tax=Sugiyamaella lignohabitans TaxID=796027 RepID=A0A161HLX4_9ASCO|nr:Vps45p [Sugiyamaella lignohabitans]ANB14507.1 Vps45p [Sugiyamaella lignohabitans]